MVYLALRPHFDACSYGDTVVAVPQPVGLNEHAMCGSQFLSTPIFWCRFGDYGFLCLLCLFIV